MNLENLKSIDDLPLFLTVSDISCIIGICLGKTYDLFHSEDFPSIKLGKRFVVYKTEFIKWLEKPKKY